MAQAKRKTATKTAKKTVAKQAPRRKQTCCKRSTRTDITNQERMHLFMIAGMSIVAGILLCANAAMMMV